MRNPFFSFLNIAICLPAPFAFGQAPPWASQIDPIFQRFQRTDGPGCSMAVVQDGKVSLRRAYGMANLDHDVVLTTGSVFHVASISKEFTAAAIQLLAKEGKLSLDDPARKYLPELPDFGQKITIRHLIHHTSGLRDQWALLGLAGWRYSLDLITDEDVLAMISRQKELNFSPGERHLYCNTGYTLMALIVRRVSGTSFGEFTSQRIFGPLNMQHSHFRDDHAETIKGNAYGYIPRDGGFRLALTNFDTAGATSLHTTVEDMALWVANFEQGRLGIGAALRERGRLNSGREIPYASGLVHGQYRGLASFGHGGADAGYRSDFVYFPPERTGVIALCNDSTANPASLTRAVADVVLAPKLGPKRKEPKTSPVPREDWDRFSGVWLNRSNDHVIRITARDGALMLTGGGTGGELRAVDSNRFAVPGRPGELRFSGNGMESLVQGAEVEKFERLAAWNLSPAQLAEYAGVYASREMEAIYQFSGQDGKLILRRLRYAPENLTVVERDLFESRFGSIRFRRDAAGDVSGFVIDTSRALHVRFTREEPARLPGR